MRDRDITFRDQMYLVCCFFGCVVKFPAREANRRAGEEARFRNECFFFLFVPPFYFEVFFFHDQSHTLTQTERCEETRKDCLAHV